MTATAPMPPFELVAGALECDPATLTADAGLTRHPAWDSVGHLNVVLALEAQYGVPVTDETIVEHETMAAILRTYERLFGRAGTDYGFWSQPSLVDRFAAKAADGFFRTETRFLAPLKDRVSSVLDVGCASGRLVELLTSLGYEASFTGVDISEANVARARSYYTDHAFMVANAVDMDLGRRFDLVNATGVFQHEPRFSALLDNLLRHSDRYVLFDVKLAAIADHLVDPRRAYSRVGDSKIPFVVLAFPKFFALLDSLPGLSGIDVYGYATPVNAETVVPDGVGPWASAGVLLTKGSGRKKISCELPDFVPRPAGMS